MQVCLANLCILRYDQQNHMRGLPTKPYHRCVSHTTAYLPESSFRTYRDEFAFRNELEVRMDACPYPCDRREPRGGR